LSGKVKFGFQNIFETYSKGIRGRVQSKNSLSISNDRIRILPRLAAREGNHILSLFRAQSSLNRLSGKHHTDFSWEVAWLVTAANVNNGVAIVQLDLWILLKAN